MRGTTVLLVSLSLVAASCGSDDDSGAATTSPTETTSVDTTVPAETTPPETTAVESETIDERTLTPHLLEHGVDEATLFDDDRDAEDAEV